MSFPPDVYLIGAQKSGTTTLTHLLSQHPNICIGKRKEPHFFTYNWSKGLAWYQDKFSLCENAVCIDASTSYSMAPLNVQENINVKKYLQNVPQKIYSVNPKAKFIYLLRDPVERTYSGYWHRVNRGREQKSFGEVIAQNDCFYLDVSNYYGQLALWLEYFPIESFLFVLFEDMKTNSTQIAKECFNFIGVESENIPLSLGAARNKSTYVNVFGRHCNRLFKTLDHSGFDYLAPSYIRGFIHKLTTDNDRGLPKMSDTERTFLRTYFSENKPKLELLTNLSLSQWQA